MPPIKLSKAAIQQTLQLLIRTFDSRSVTVERATKTYSALKQQQLGMSTVYRGEALMVPAGSSVEVYGLGQVENASVQLLIVGRRGIQQGDFVTLDGKRFQIRDAPVWWHGYTTVALKQWEQ